MGTGVHGLVEADDAAAEPDRRGRDAGRCAGNGGVERLGIARRDREIRLQDRGQSVRELRPGRATVDRFVEAAARAAKRAAFDEALLLLPERGVDDGGIARVDLHVVGAGVLVLVENFLKTAAAVGRSKDAALLVRSVGMAEDGNEEPVRVVWVDGDHRDHLRIAEAKLGPGCPGIR